jgi:hypothetical protein
VTEYLPTTQIEIDRIQLRVLQFDTSYEDQRDRRRVTKAEHHALERVLDELHRMNKVADQQRRELIDANNVIRSLREAKARKRSHTKPAAARSGSATTNRTRQKGYVRPGTIILILITAIIAIVIAATIIRATAQQKITSPIINLTWAPYTQGSDPAVKLIVWRSLTSGGPYAIAATLDISVTSWTDTNIAYKHLETTTYYYVTTAVDANGNNSDFSAETSATTLADNYTQLSNAGAAKPAAPATPAAVYH